MYKTSCWPSYWRIAHEALPCNWPPACVEVHPAITSPHKRSGIKPNCMWALTEADWGRTALLLTPLISPQEGPPHNSQKKILICEGTSHLSRKPISFWCLFNYPPSWPLNQRASELSMAIIKEKVTSSNNLLIGFGSFSSPVMCCPSWSFWCEGSPVVFSIKKWFRFFFEDPCLWFWILDLINFDFHTLYSAVHQSFIYLHWKYHVCARNSTICMIMLTFFTVLSTWFGDMPHKFNCFWHLSRASWVSHVFFSSSDSPSDVVCFYVPGGTQMLVCQTVHHERFHQTSA